MSYDVMRCFKPQDLFPNRGVPFTQISRNPITELASKIKSESVASNLIERFLDSHERIEHSREITQRYAIQVDLDKEIDRNSTLLAITKVNAHRDVTIRSREAIVSVANTALAMKAFGCEIDEIEGEERGTRLFSSVTWGFTIRAKGRR